MFSSRLNTLPAALLTLIVLAVTGCGAAQAEEGGAATTSSSAVHTFVDFSEIPGTGSTLVRTNDGVAMELHTYNLEAGHAYTVWWVVFNTPGGCSEACGEDDIFDSGGNVAPNPDANVSILWATGGVASSEGTGVFSAYLPEGNPLGEVILGNGLQDARGAEVHLVVRTHGAADTDKLFTQLNTFEPDPAMGGSCETCQDMQFAVHAPDQAVAGN